MIKRAFTLVEMVMAIVVMGIIAMIGTDIMTNMYEGYLRSKATNYLQAETSHVLDIISKRLSYRIKDSIVTSINGTNYIKLSHPDINETYNILEWIGYDNEGFVGEHDGSRFSGWSGYIDLDNPATTKAQIKTSGSRLDLANDSIKALSYESMDLDVMAVGSSASIVSGCNYNMEPVSYGYTAATHDLNVILRIRRSSNDTFAVETPAAVKEYCERYSLAWSAYAIEPIGPSNDFNLTLRYDYQPWENERYSSGRTTLLAQHVTTFRFIQLGHTVRVKLCIKDPKLDYGFCKEKAIF